MGEFVLKKIKTVKTAKRHTGDVGEDRACDYLKKHGYKIVARNEWKPWGEIDIIARAKDGTLVFVEVKTVNADGSEEVSLKAEDNLTTAKLRKLRRVCELYVAGNPKAIYDFAGWRVDLVALTSIEKDCTINHYENI